MTDSRVLESLPMWGAHYSPHQRRVVWSMVCLVASKRPAWERKKCHSNGWQRRSRSVREPTATLARPRVWIVDDSPTEASITERALGAGYEFETFDDGSIVVE